MILISLQKCIIKKRILDGTIFAFKYFFNGLDARKMTDCNFFILHNWSCNLVYILPNVAKPLLKLCQRPKLWLKEH